MLLNGACCGASLLASASVSDHEEPISFLLVIDETSMIWDDLFGAFSSALHPAGPMTLAPWLPGLGPNFNHQQTIW